MSASEYALKALWQKFRVRPRRQKSEYIAALIRGVLRYYAFATPHLVLLGRRVKICRHNGHISAGGVCVIHSDCKIAVSAANGSEAELFIGEGTEIGDRTIINVSHKVHIGARCSISWDCDISDTDFHQIFLANGRAPVNHAPVIIEDDVWIGSHCLIGKGVTIGHHSVIGAGSVLRRSVPPYSLVAGNPARRVSEIDGWQR